MLATFAKRMRQNPRQLFLIDALGALVSTISLGFVLTNLERFFGMPVPTLHLLATIASVFCVYSFACYKIQPKQWQRAIRIIAIANILYCCLTFGLLLSLSSVLTFLAWGYFIGEIILVVGLAVVELKTAALP